MSSDVDYYLMAKRAGYYDQAMEQRLQETTNEIDEGQYHLRSMELAKNITDQAHNLRVQTRYKELRRAGQSDSIAAMLALGKAPAGIVR